MNSEKIESFVDSSIADLVRGYRKDSRGDFRCLYCGTRFEEGLVYPVLGGQALAERAAQEHLESSHGGAFAALLALGPSSSGLTEIQEKILRLLHEGADDRAIASALGGKSESTVRNHRYNLRRRALEAKVFLALFGLVEEKAAAGGAERFVEYPPSLPTKDERAAVTESEAAAIEAKCLTEKPNAGIAISFWPKKQKDKLVVLRRIAELFERGRSYTESETNDILLPVFGDYVTIRRYLIEYRFLDREPDGSAYWRT